MEIRKPDGVFSDTYDQPSFGREYVNWKSDFRGPKSYSARRFDSKKDETEHNELLRLEISSQILPLNSTGNNSNEPSVPSFQFLLPDITGNNSTEDAVTSQLLPTPISQTRIPHVAPPAVKETTAKKYNLNTLIANTLQNHENRAKERAEKRCHHDEGDELQHFFNTMYAITKKCKKKNKQ